MDSLAPKNEDNKISKTGGIILFIFVLLWVITGFAAFITSIVCFGRSGSTADKVVGLLLALFLGPLVPFYFLYLGVNKNYCRRVK